MMSATLLMADAALAVTSAADAGVSARALEYDRPIAAADLAGRTLRELAIMRQYPLARAGGTMPASWLQHYFNDQGRPWYRRVKVPAKLKPLDRDNIAASIGIRRRCRRRIWKLGTGLCWCTNTGTPTTGHSRFRPTAGGWRPSGTTR